MSNEVFRLVLASICVASIVSGWMFAKPIIPLRMWVHRWLSVGGVSWGTCGFCASAPVSAIVVWGFNLNYARFTGGLWYPAGYVLAWLVLLFCGSLLHFFWVSMIGNVFYPPLPNESEGEVNLPVMSLSAEHMKVPVLKSEEPVGYSV